MPTASDSEFTLSVCGRMCPEHEGPCPASNILRILEPPAHMFSAKGKICHLQATEVVLPLPLGARLTLLSWLSCHALGS